MGETSKIQWTQATWNPWHGCHKVSPGCKNCYMFSEKKMYGQNPDVVVCSKTTFNAPLKWKEPLDVFTCSWSDFFIEEADAWRDEAWSIIRRTPHRYQILTKRIERAAICLPPDWPLKNVLLGVSVEDKKYGVPRIDALRALLGRKFVSIEPLLEDLGRVDFSGIEWGIIGGESGVGARPFGVQWALDLIAQMRRDGCRLFVKQLGAKPVLGNESLSLRDRKGGDPSEWPEWLNVREMPEAV